MENRQYLPDIKEFTRLSKKGNLIPVYRELLADYESPVSAFKKIDDGKYSFLLESAEGQEKIGRFSFLASSPELVVRSFKGEVQVLAKSRAGFKVTKRIKQTDPLLVIEQLMAKYKFVSVKNVPIFCGGMVGFVSYDAVRHFEHIPDKNKDDLNVAECIFILAETILVFDHLNRTIKVISNAHIENKQSVTAAYKQAKEKIDIIVNLLKKPLPCVAPANVSSVDRKGFDTVSNISKADFTGIVNKAKKYINDGDIIQTVLSQRFQVKFSAVTLDIYRMLRAINPSPYMFYLKYDGFELIGSSPEILVRCENKMVQVRPIAGTRHRGADAAEDERLEIELLNDPKEKAEHIMLVDLGRNDIGRVCVKGTVQVTELMAIEKYSHVMHIVSNVQGRLLKNYNQFDVLRATFPAGTVTGAPKIRAMEIIDELENTKRGPYAGCVGYFSFSGNLDSCITIRTILAKNNIAYVQAGAGIVADSVPEREYKETENKARALIKAIEMAEAGSL